MRTRILLSLAVSVIWCGSVVCTDSAGDSALSRPARCNAGATSDRSSLPPYGQDQPQPDTGNPEPADIAQPAAAALDDARPHQLRRSLQGLYPLCAREAPKPADRSGVSLYSGG